MSPPTREIPRVELTVEQIIERAQKAADSSIAKVNTLVYYLTMIHHTTGTKITGTTTIITDLEEIYSLLDDLKEE